VRLAPRSQSTKMRLGRSRRRGARR
jgi:hypothetical protein